MGVRVADDDGTAVVTHRTGEDFGSGGRELGGQHDQRAVPGYLLVFIAIVFGATIAAADLEDGTLRDEEARDVDRLGQEAAAVLAEIHDEGLHAHRLEFVDQLLDISRGARARAVGIFTVERREVDDAEQQRAIAVGDFEGLGGGHLADELDLVALENDRLAAASGHVDKQADGRTLLTADAADGLREAHADDIFHLATRALADRDNLVSRLGLTGEVEWATGEDVLDDADPVFVRERRPDAHERVAHRDLELL